MTPLLVLSVLPAAFYVALPVAYLYPDKLLCRHFWSLEQQIKFGEREYAKKTKVFQPIYENLLIHADLVFSGDDSKAKYDLIDLINKVIRTFLIEQR